MTITAIDNLIGTKEICWWDGLDRSFIRRTSTGGNLTNYQVGNVVDVLHVYGDGTAYTAATINKALAAVGGTDTVGFLLAPGSWAIDANVTGGSNIIFFPQPGAILQIASGKVFTGRIECGLWQCFDDLNADYSGVVFSGHMEKILPQWWGATGDGTTDDQDACQAAVTSAIASTYAKVVYFPAGTYLIDGLAAANTGITIMGENRYRSILRSSGNDYTITISGPNFRIANLGFTRADRSIVGRGIRIYHASVVSKWASLENLYFENLKGCAIKADGLNVYEFNIKDVVAAMCGDNTVDGTNDEAVVDILGSATSDHNNITIDTCFINAFYGPAVRVYNLSEPAGGTTPGFRVLRIRDNMFHAAASYADLTAQPCNNLDLQGVSDVRISGNNFAKCHDTYNAISITKAYAAAQLSQRIKISDNRMNGPIKLAYCQEVTLGHNDWLFAGAATAGDEHLIIGATCQFVQIEKQRVTTGISFYVDNRGASEVFTATTSITTKYWYQAVDGITFLAAAGYGTGINGAKNVSGVATLTNPATTEAVVFDTEEDDTNYNIILSANYDCNVFFTNKATTGFTVNVNPSPAAGGSVCWFLVR